MTYDQGCKQTKCPFSKKCTPKNARMPPMSGIRSALSILAPFYTELVYPGFNCMLIHPEREAK